MSFLVGLQSACLFVARADLDTQYQAYGKDRKQGEQAETYVQRNLSVLQSTESPVGQSTKADAHEIHDPVSGRAMIRPDDLREDRHAVAIEKAPS